MPIFNSGTSQSPSKFLAFAGLLFAYALVATSAQGQTLQSISVTPANPSIAAGTGQQFTATGTYSDNSTQNLTTSVTWTSTSTSVATITTAGLAAGLAPGSTTIEATSGTITGSTTLTVTGSGLVGYWTFNDGTGTTAADSSGNGLTATLVNGVSWVTGKLGDAISANGVNQYGTVPAINLAGTSTVTVAMWVNRTYSTAGGHTLFEFSSNYNSSTTGFGLFPDDSSCKGISAAVHGNVGYSVACYTQPSSGAWHHLAIIYDKTQAGSNAVNLYIDGVLQTAISRPNTAKNTNAFGSNPLYLFTRGGTQEYTAGEMDDLRLYNRALSATEIEEIYLAGNAQLLSLSVTPASPSIAKGATQQFTATGTYSDGTKQNLTTSVTWSSTSTSVATITSGGLATGVGTGSATIQATSGAISGSTGLTVTPPTLVSIAVTPANPSIASGTTQQFTATGTYSDTSTQNLTSSVTWSSSSTAAATIASGGLATGVATGVSTIQATLGSISGSTSLTVTSVLVSITVTPANASLAKGATQQYAATGLFSDNGTLNLTSSVTWTSTNPAAATIASGGLATGVAAGSTTIQAALGGTSGSTGLTVTPPALVSIAVTPANSSLTIGATQQFTATGTYSDNSTQNLTSSATWTSTNTAVATITSGGLATGVAAGSTTIQATSGSITGSTGLTVTPSNLVGWWTFNDGSGTTAADSSGNGLTASLVNGVSWVTGKLGDAISANGVNQYGTVPAINLSGTKSVTVAMWLNRTYSTTGNVLLEFSTNYNSVNTGFGFFPDDSSCGGIQAAVHGAIGYSVGCYKQPTSGVWHHIAIVYDKTQAGSNAVNLYLDGVLQTATSRPYTSTNTESFGSNPLYFFSRGGSQLFTAGEMDDLRVYNVALTATQIQQIYQAGSPSLVSIAVTPANGSIAKGTTQQFTATGTYSDNSTQNLTGSVTWSSTNTTVATITSGGLATGVGTGSTTIQATSGSISGSTGATVTPPALVSIAVTPANPSIASGTTQQFTATGTYSDTSTQNLTSSVTWSSSNTAAATISSTGLATGVATGTSTIEATLGSISGSTSLTVTSVLVSITVTPANASLAKGATQQYTATGLFSDNGTLNLTSSVTWTSTNPAAATIASGGLATGVAAGSTTIQAALGGTSGSTGLTVTPPALVSIAVTPANSSLTIGATQQYTATGTYSDNSTQNLTSSATWVSTSTSVATITSGGLATGVAAGSTTIQAKSGAITGSTGLTVTPSNLVGWWTFNDGSGTTAADSSGNGLTASLVNGVSWVTGKIGDAISANGVNQYGTVPAINLSGTKSVTVAMWLNRTYSTTGNVLLEFSTNYNSVNTGFGFFPDDSSCGGIQAAVHGAAGYSVGCYKQPTSGVWHHIAIVYDKTQAGSNQVNLYLDGVLQTATSRPYTSTNTESFGSNPLYFFSRGGSQLFSTGEMDDLRVYNVALTATQIQQIYQAGSPSLVSIAVTPANGSIAKGTTQQFTATGTYSDNSTQNLTSSVTWSSTNTTVATITSGGLATGVGTGSTTIQATSGAISGTTGATVTPPVLTSIALTPANPEIVKASTQQFTATGTYSDSSTQSVTSSVTWSSSNTAVATIASGGLATGVAPGTTTIQATSGSVSGSTGLTVTATLLTFAYARPITLNNSGSTLTNYQVKIALNSSNMNFSHAKSDGSDVRVRASDGVTSLSYWIENWNSSSQVATVWALAPSIPSGASTIYLVYGNSSASTTASGTTTFPFFDDFSSGDASTLNGYYKESALATINLGAAQAWEGSDVPHFFTVIANPYGATLDGTQYTYWAWYGLHDPTKSGIGLAGSNDLVNWHKYSANPVIATGASRPSVIFDGTTLQMAYENTANTQQVGYATSTNGTSWTIQTPFTSDGDGGFTPALWKNPNDSKFYLFWSSGPLSSNQSFPIYVRSASTMAALVTAADTQIWTLQTSSPSFGQNNLYAPTNILYDSASGLYVLQFESGPNTQDSSTGDDTTWDVTTLLSTSPTSGWYMSAGNPFHTGGNACPTSFNAGGTLYTYYCHYTGSAWVIDYTTANVAAGLQQYGKPKTSLWTDVHDTSDQPPVWYLQPCTDWKGNSSTCLMGFARYSGVNHKDPMLESSYSGTNYILDGQVYGIEGTDAQLGFRMSATSGDEYSAEAYYNHNGSANFDITEKAPAVRNVVGSVAAGNLFFNTWYQVEASTSSTTQAGSIENGTYSASGTDTTYASGSAGPSLELYGASMFSYLFIRPYASPVPSNSVGSETSGSY